MKLLNDYYWFASAISEEKCKKIIELGESTLKKERQLGNPTHGYTVGSAEKQSMPDAKPRNDTPLVNSSENTYVRDSEVAWLNERWLYDLITPYVYEANERAGWKWNIDYHESIQFTKYNLNGFYGWHKDGDSDHNGAYKRYIHGVTKEPLHQDGKYPIGYTTDKNIIGKIRKISMTINLNTPGEYQGGDLKFDFGMHVPENDRFHFCEEIKPQGSIIVFPSFIDHCVTPVTMGTRYSLVLWSLGDPWK
jgi:PKHD-type hydroxylase